MEKVVKYYDMVLVKPYDDENGDKKFTYTVIGTCSKKAGSNIVDLKMELFPIMTPGAFIQIKPKKEE